MQDLETTMTTQQAGSRNSSTPVLDSIFSTIGAQTVPPTPDGHAHFAQPEGQNHV